MGERVRREWTIDVPAPERGVPFVFPRPSQVPGKTPETTPRETPARPDRETPDPGPEPAVVPA